MPKNLWKYSFDLAMNQVCQWLHNFRIYFLKSSITFSLLARWCWKAVPSFKVVYLTLAKWHQQYVFAIEEKTLVYLSSQMFHLISANQASKDELVRCG